jgi:hypothetical protein
LSTRSPLSSNQNVFRNYRWTSCTRKMQRAEGTWPRHERRLHHREQRRIVERLLRYGD